MSLRILLSAIAAITIFSGFAHADDVYQTIYNSVDRTKLIQLLKDMTGVNPVTVGAETFSITDRFLPATKAEFRKYYANYFQSLGIPVAELPYTTQYNLEKQGHNVEAVLKGQLADTVVIIVHYDSIGPHGSDNPGVDDDMTGMAMMLETARIFKQYQARLKYTVRFVAADYEEWGALEGAQKYLAYIQGLSKTQGFNIVAAIDDEQSGWRENKNQVAFYTACTGNAGDAQYAQLFAATVAKYSQMTQAQQCMGDSSDFYAFSSVNIPAVVFSENDPFSNDHFDGEGGDTFDKIDQDYFFSISQIGVTYAAEIVGVDVVGGSSL